MAEPVQVGLLTPTGAGAVAVVRVSGGRAASLMTEIFRPARGGTFSNEQLADGRIRYGSVVDGEEVLDDVLVAAAPGGEIRAVDICAHGGMRVLQRILALCERRGAEVLAPGSLGIHDVWPGECEFEDEVFAALRDARTEPAVDFLLRQRETLPREIERLAAHIRTESVAVRAALRRLIDGYSTSRALLEGAVVGLIGPTNSGKSTLFNRLAGREASIVSPIPGTTRDWVSAEIELLGVPIRLIDTAGLRDGAELLERVAISAGAEIASRCAARVLVLDGAEGRVPAIENLTGFSADPRTNCLLVWNKSDRMDPTHRESCMAAGRRSGLPQVAASALRGDGLEELGRQLLGCLGIELAFASAPCPFTVRQVGLLENAHSLLHSDPSSAEASVRQVTSSRPRSTG